MNGTFSRCQFPSKITRNSSLKHRYLIPALTITISMFIALVVVSCGGGGGDNNGAASSLLYLYALDPDFHRIHGFDVDPESGQLTAIPGSPFATSASPYSISITPDTKYMYVPALGPDNVNGYAISPSTGALTPLSGFPVNVPDFLNIAVMAPSGEYLYILSSQDWGRKYDINPADGTISAGANPVFSTSLGNQDMVFTPSGDHAYITVYNGDNTINAYAYSISNGDLTQISGSPYQGPSEPYNAAVDPSGEYLFVSEANTGGMVGFSVDGATGALTEMSGSPFTIPGVGSDIAIESTGRFVFTSNLYQESISAYAISPTGETLVEVSGSPYAASGEILFLAIDPEGKYMASAGRIENKVMIFQIDQGTGSLSAVPGASFYTSGRPRRMEFLEIP